MSRVVLKFPTTQLSVCPRGRGGRGPGHHRAGRGAADAGRGGGGDTVSEVIVFTIRRGDKV